MASIRGIVVNLPRDLPWFDGMEELIKFTHSTTYDYHELPPFRDQYINCSRHLSQHPFSTVISGIEDKDPEKLLDLGLRYYHGCTAEPSLTRALDAWEMITKEGQDSVPEEKLTASVLARAFSCLADAHMTLMHLAFDGESVMRHDGSDRMLPSGERDPIMANDFMRAAAAYSDASAAFGMVSPVVLYVARWLTQIGERDGVNVRETERYKVYPHLWQAWDVRVAEMDEERRKREAKLGRAPTAYVCAAQGCGITAKQKKGLMKCAGKCPIERKPHYCSKNCQRKDWKSHKRYCKPDKELGDVPPPPPPEQPVDLDGIPRLNYNPSDILQRVDYEGPDRSIEIPLAGPGKRTVTIHSRNFTPEAMRLMRDVIVADDAEKQAKPAAEHSEAEETPGRGDGDTGNER
uniref:N/A n=1 Tax=Ganoderma boninense TaxID=34458 RepID=A0A5K1JX70_9APHY|nr:N/A [Ganoderma boninense]